MFQMYRWGNTPLDEAILSGNNTLIELLEEAKSSQLSSQITSSSKEPSGIKIYVFAYLIILKHSAINYKVSNCTNNHSCINKKGKPFKFLVFAFSKFSNIKIMKGYQNCSHLRP